MKNLIKTFSIVLAGFFFSAQADELELTILDSEYWWAGLSSKGYEMPYDQSSKVVYDLWGDNKGNRHSLFYYRIKDDIFGVSIQ